jgi:hypothetical protein
VYTVSSKASVLASAAVASDTSAATSDMA